MVQKTSVHFFGFPTEIDDEIPSKCHAKGPYNPRGTLSEFGHRERIQKTWFLKGAFNGQAPTCLFNDENLKSLHNC